jgi:hypothetical protein
MKRHARSAAEQQRYPIETLILPPTRFALAERGARGASAATNTGQPAAIACLNVRLH